MNWDGFLMGLGDFTQDRLKEERQKKMQKELLELKEKYTIEAEERQEARTIAAETRKQGQYDSKLDSIEVLEDGSGLLHRRTAGGASLDSVPLSAKDSRLIAHKRETEKHDMELRSKENTMNYQNRSLDLQGQQIAARNREVEALARAGGTGSTSNPIDYKIQTFLSPLLEKAERPSVDEMARLRSIGYAAADLEAQPGETRSFDQIFTELLSGNPMRNTAGEYDASEWSALPRPSHTRTPSFRFDLTQPRR